MTVEERLARALHEEAEGIEVDTARLYDATRDLLTAPPPRTRRRRAHDVRPLLVAAVLAALVVGVVTLVHRDPGGPEPVGPDRSGRVSTVFTCPRQITIDRAGRREDDSFLPSLDRGAQAAAADLGAPRYAYAATDTRATLRLGNADGSLASTSTFRRVSDHWVLLVTRKCAGSDGGILVPGTDPLRLGRRDATPYAARRIVDDPAHAVLVDDRSTYDASGLVRHQSLYVTTCGAKICLAGGSPTSLVTSDVESGAAPADITSLLLDPDSTVGRSRSLILWVVYDADRSVPSVAARLRDGTALLARRFSGPGWRGRAYLLLAPRADVRAVLVRHLDAPTTTYPATDVTGP